MSEQLITVEEAAKLIPSNPSYVSVWRWLRVGLRARSGEVIRLRHVRYGARLYTTAAYVAAFAEELAAADAAHFERASLPETNKPQPTRSGSRREREIASARKRLKDAGIA